MNHPTLLRRDMSLIRLNVRLGLSLAVFVEHRSGGQKDNTPLGIGHIEYLAGRITEWKFWLGKG
jgi:hypothetical protein